MLCSRFHFPVGVPQPQLVLLEPHLHVQVLGALCQTLATSAMLIRSNANLDSGQRELNCWYCCYAECDESGQAEATGCTLLLRRIAAREEVLPLRLAPKLHVHRPSAETVDAVRDSLHEWQRQSCGTGVASSAQGFPAVRTLRRNHQDQLQALLEASIKAQAKAQAKEEAPLEADAGVVKPQLAVDQPRASAKHAPLKLAVTPRRPPSPPPALKRPGKIVITPAHKEKENGLSS